MIERTLILIKPDGVIRGLMGDVIKRFEQRGLKIIGMKLVNPDKKIADEHYSDLGERHGEKIKNDMVDYLISGPNLAVVVEGVDAIANVRKIAGSTFPNEASIGTIRGDFAHTSKEYGNKVGRMKNLVHASSSKQDAENEIKLWFNENEIVGYKLSYEDQIS